MIETSAVTRSTLHIALGTYVWVRVQARSATDGDRAIAKAREAIAACEARFSLYQPDSELCQINALAATGAVVVSGEMFDLLTLCAEIALGSHFLFDPTVGGELVAMGLRPGVAHAGQWSDIVLDHANRSVRFLRPLTLDLGGVAKGAAVDRAVEAAMKNGATGVLVDAGGDMRACGVIEQDVRVRDPRDARRSLPLMRLANAAIATSGGALAARTTSHGKQVVPTLDPSRTDTDTDAGTAQHSLLHKSVSVTAPCCAVADALTKVVQLSGDVQHPLLARFAAQALCIDATDTEHYVIETTRAAA